MQDQTFSNRIYSTNITLLLGFGLLLLLLAIQTTLSTTEMESQRKHLEQVTQNMLEKTRFTQMMVESARERGDILMQIYYEEDAFRLDEMAIRFSELAGHFMAAREKLLELDLTPKELEAQEFARLESSKGTEIFNHVFNLALSEQWMSERVREEAFYLLTEQAIPACQMARMSIEEIHRITEESSRYAIEQARAEYETTRTLLWILGTIIFLLSAAIVLLVYHRVSSSSRQLQHIHEQMESQIQETITMFNISVALMEHSVAGGDEAIRNMIDQLRDQSGMIQSIQERLQQLPNNAAPINSHNSSPCTLPLPQTEGEIKQDCDTMEATLSEAIVIFQDFDRISQQITQIGNNLNATAELLNDPLRINNTEAWEAIHQQMRDTFVMNDAQVLYEEMISGTSKEEALKRAKEAKEQSRDSFELF